MTVGGPEALILTALLNGDKFDVTIYEANKTIGKKFLMYKKGSLNLKHPELNTEHISRYTLLHFLEKILLDLDNNDFSNWMESIGIPTYILIQNYQGTK